MIIYRLAVEQYANDLSGTGSKLLGGRWNSINIPMLYTTQNISLAVLEIIVNTERIHIPKSYMLLKMNISDDLDLNTISNEKLKKNWKDDFEYTRFMGNEFIKQNKALILKVPSAVVNQEFNYLFNPLHKDFKKLKLLAINKFAFDKRLHLNNE